MRLSRFFAAIIILSFLISCNRNGNKYEVLKYADPFIGTGAHGHNYPGATLPFAMVQLSPDTRLDTWDGCGGYHYSDSSIIGFSHTHLSGTGVSDYGDVLFQPFTGNIQWNPGKRGQTDSGYRSRFSHQNEKASPGYYQVMLSDDSINVELTTTPRVGFHKYEYPKGSNARVIVDLTHRDPLMKADIKQISDTEIEGYRVSKLWAGEQYVYFVARFSEPIKAIEFKQAKAEQFLGTTPEGNQKAIFDFGDVNALKVKVALSGVSCEGARKNLDAELDHWNFENVHHEARNVWHSHLSKIEVEGGTKVQKRNFYTAFYHSLLTPNLYSDVDGKYRGMDLKVHQDKNFTNYTVFSLWDTFRALHPLLTITNPKETEEFCKSLIHKAEQFGEIPMWELASNDTRCMIGYHGVSVLADAILKNIGDIDIEKAYQAMKKSANVEKRGINFYGELGFVPYNRSSQAVSKTLEYAYNDWCIAQIAKKLGKTHDYEHYIARAQFYKNLYDKETGFMRPRSDKREWEKDFDPMRVGFSFTEGNSFQYSLFVPHDVEGLKELVGGEKAFEHWLDKLFETEIDHELEEGTDVTGLIGNYAHGNEPSHHLAYMYNYTNSPWKTQERTHQILNELYLDTPGGICGNEDCGQMSAWYVLSAMGFYSMCPGMDSYTITSPLFDKITLNLPNNKRFVISTRKTAEDARYIQSMQLNGTNYTANHLKHADILKGGTIEFKLSNSIKEAMLFERSDQEKISKAVAIPYVLKAHRNFNHSTIVDIYSDTQGAKIYYTLDGSIPGEHSILYVGPFVINQSVMLKAVALKDGMIPSVVFEKDFVKSTPVSGKDLKQGLNYKVYNGIYRSVYDWKNDKSVKQGVVSGFSNECRDRDEWYGLHFDGYIYIPADDVYTFTVYSNDGGQMLINGEELFESDGRKSHSLMQAYKLELKKGYHKIDLKYYQCSDANELSVYWESSRIKKQLIPEINLFH